MKITMTFDMPHGFSPFDVAPILADEMDYPIVYTTRQTEMRRAAHTYCDLMSIAGRYGGRLGTGN